MVIRVELSSHRTGVLLRVLEGAGALGPFGVVFSFAGRPTRGHSDVYRPLGPAIPSLCHNKGNKALLLLFCF